MSRSAATESKVATVAPSEGPEREPGVSNLITEFKAFVNRGNVVDLAVAVVLGAAFTAVVTAFVDGVLMPIVAAIVGQPDFTSLTIDIGDAQILYGVLITAVVNFLLVAFAVFLVVKALNEMQRRRAHGEAPAEEEPPAPTETELLAEIRDLLAGRQEPQV